MIFLFLFIIFIVLYALFMTFLNENKELLTIIFGSLINVYVFLLMLLLLYGKFGFFILFVVTAIMTFFACIPAFSKYSTEKNENVLAIAVTSLLVPPLCTLILFFFMPYE